MTENTEVTEESGGALRQKLEETNDENRALKAALAQQVAGSFQFVKAEDLVGIAPNDLQAKAEELEQARKAERATVLVEELKSRGWTPEQIEQFQADPEKPVSQERQNVHDVVNHLPGGPPPRESAAANAEPGRARIQAAIEERDRRRGDM